MKSYLLVDKWTDNGSDIPQLTPQKDLIRRASGTGKGAKREAGEYERHLNGGRSRTKCDSDFIENGKPFFSVCAETYSSCRDYEDFREWCDCANVKLMEIENVKVG
jgi:hypothetical protein